ncbi:MULTISPECIES: hypothetical protein [Acinetobacter]|uniref:Uncharacterized protein n=3 Tax=Acinetobacter haemolyticus TaxID=29430 RepID=A0AAW4JA28_ACIHA|nr:MULTISPECIES: hypothetical protein [Acinetobacter]EEH67465.1 hypothetical protein HMPREF0023_3003 [Acinetobacter sp. ATCC 27244]EFF82700.1 hypothetical protein HMP0015_1795 [Acinetobacter haemolyticus ATCC 19194]ENW18613.1 hypothetical protein F927_01392 [Acinetobacter haemolyticus CIP 64.3 = MTCC 9819]ENW19818.1 hypothetical protein F926_02173 [Acinetobacter haemolyticus NIPH 261]EPR88489.1 hypothetical protein L313_2379 [Acinetobacter haemolyticus CIP 64.3 = MTCC 9819]
MTQLINKGGFRERANRSRSYKQSENKVTTLTTSQYQPQIPKTTSEAEEKPLKSKDEQ